MLKEIQSAYKEWEKNTEFITVEGASDEDEGKIMDTIQTILEKNKQKLKINPLYLAHGGNSSIDSSKRRKTNCAS